LRAKKQSQRNRTCYTFADVDATSHDCKIENRKIRFMNVQIEIATTKCWMLRPSYLRLFRHRYEEGLITLEDEDKVICRYISARTGEDLGEDYLMDEGTGGQPATEQRDKFVSLLMVDGPVTRNGGACSYGSRDLRDKLMDNARHPDCIGHIFYINTPGGSAWAKNDFQQAIDYAHSKNQPVIAYVDGMCCSAGMYLAALCDERYYMHPKNEIGCIGVMAAFYTEKDGEKNEATGETYHELYDPESFDKNKEMRDIANDNNDKLLIDELAKLGVEFRADVKKACPNAKEEHLHGKVFSAEEVKGILMDGQKTLQEVFNRIVEISPAAKDGSGKSATRSGRMQAGAAKENILSPTNNSINMKENYPAVFALLGVEEMQLSEEGTFFNKDLLATLNSAIEAKNKETADAKALAEQLTSEKNELTAQIETLNADHQKAIDDLKAEHAQAVETLNADHQKAIDDLNAEHATAIEEKDNQISALEQEKADLAAAATTKDEEIATLKADAEGKASQIEQLTTDLNGAKESLTTAEGTIAERDQTISDLNAQITELQNNPGAEPAAGAAPQNNGGGADAPQVVVNQYVYDPSLSYKENRELEKKWNEEHGK
jgi:protease-4